MSNLRVKRPAKRVKINWSQQLAHPEDYRLRNLELASKRHKRLYAESGDESGGRVVEFKGVACAGVLSIGYDEQARGLPSRQAIAYDRVTGRWEVSNYVGSNSFEVTRMSNLNKQVTHDSLMRINRYKGGSW